MKNYDLFMLADQLANNIEKLKALKGAKFTFGILKNIDILEKEIKLFSEYMKPSDAYMVYDKARVALCETHCAKDEKGELLKKEAQPGSGSFEYEIDTKSPAWLEAIEGLKTEYAETIAARDEQIAEYNKLLDAETELELHKIKLDDVPNDISLDLMRVVKVFIKE